MCLVLAFTNMKKVNLRRCLNDIGNTLLKSEKDGFGYAIQGRGGVFGEKTIARRFRTRLGHEPHVVLPIVKVNYEEFGRPTELVGPGIFHGRTATNVVSLPNTHPMQIEGWNLIHNGVVSDYGPKYANTTDNDSEDVLRRLLDGVAKPNPMEDIEKYLEGYYAFAAIDPEGKLHIAVDCYASLHIAHSAKYETFIIGTTEALLLKVNKILDAKIGPIDKIESETYCIFEGNNLKHYQYFKSRGYTKKQSDFATASLGRALEPEVINIKAVIDGSSEPIVESKRKYYQTASEADWQDSIVDFLKIEHSEPHPDRSSRGSTAEDDYYKFKNEIDNMDASYEVYGIDDKPISLQEFRKMDFVAQELCTILRGDGSIVSPNQYDIPRLRGRHGAQ